MRFDFEIFLLALETWGALICILAFVFNALFRRHRGYGSPQLAALQLSCSLMIIGDVTVFFFRDYHSELSFFLVNIGFFVSFSVAFICFVFFIRYLCSFIHPDMVSKSIIYAVYASAGIGVFLTVTNLLWVSGYYGDVAQNYHRGRIFLLIQVMLAFLFLLLAVFVLHNRNHFGSQKTMTFLSYIIFPAVALIVQQVIHTNIAVANIGIFLSVALMTVVLFIDQQKDIFNQREQLLQKEQELLSQQRKIGEMQVRLVISQIQPHFLYNTLNTIYYLCEKDVGKAQEAINYFSHYLRGNMDALRKLEPVPFDTELNHVKNYLELEKMRYEDELQIIYDIEDKNFCVPTLSLQPLVENAVKHGVGKKDGGGTVTIRTRRMADSVEIIVEDDGVGYDTTQPRGDDSRSHIGIDNVRERLNEMVGGTLTMRSREGEGTVAVIHIPQ